MRQLQKLRMPAVLAANENQWTADYVAAVARGDARQFERWRHRQIKETLRLEVQKRCAYCEAFVDDVSFPHVEHIVPKSARPELAHRWRNLTSACGRCNTAKGDYYDAATPLLDPYEVIDPHLEILGCLINWALGSTSGEVTVKRLQLNRIDLVLARVRRVMELREALERWHLATDPRRAILGEAIRLDVEEGEYPSVATCLLSAHGFPA
jgi:uncharacterized protein (TIGR02646 family)